MMVWRRFRVCAAEGDPGDALRQEQLLMMPCVVEVIELRWERQCPWRVLCEMFDLQLLGVSWPTSGL